MMTESAGSEIRTEPCPKCDLCGCEGTFMYSNQRDRLFGASGSWNLKRCLNKECGLIWLDPMPLEEDIGKAYASYYTHAANNSGRVGLLKRIYQLIKRGYLAGRFNYHGDSAGFAVRSLGKLLYLFPLRRGEVEASVRYLHQVAQGRLLDVGCGSGEWLLSMRELGWRVEGLDFDENAVRVARQMGMDVTLGALEDQHYPDDSFDAVTLNHVIEHVPDPNQTMRECARILKKGGRLALGTPNSSSLSHQLFKQNWRGLEPPRHLHLFSMLSMRHSLELAGLRVVSIHPHITKSVICESVLLWRGRTGPFTASDRSWPLRVFALFFNFVEWCLLKWNPSVADCMVAVAVKQ